MCGLELAWFLRYFQLPILHSNLCNMELYLAASFSKVFKLHVRGWILYFCLKWTSNSHFMCADSSWSVVESWHICVCVHIYMDTNFYLHIYQLHCIVVCVYSCCPWIFTRLILNGSTYQSCKSFFITFNLFWMMDGSSLAKCCACFVIVGESKYCCKTRGETGNSWWCSPWEQGIWFKLLKELFLT